MLNRKNASKVFALLGIVGVFAATTSSAFAETTWQKEHPRRTEVNKRLAHQNKRIKKEVKEGEITKAQAKKLHAEDRAIRQEERDMAKLNGGHITKAEQRSLNQQENTVSRQIGK
jgi:CRISPR/Cas system-associated endoribonuclease Cas2